MRVKNFRNFKKSRKGGNALIRPSWAKRRPAWVNKVRPPMFTKTINTYGVGSTKRFFQYDFTANPYSTHVIPISYIINGNIDESVLTRYRYVKFEGFTITVAPTNMVGLLKINHTWEITDNNNMINNDSTKYLYTHTVQTRTRYYRVPNSDLAVATTDKTTYNFRKPVLIQNLKQGDAYYFPGRIYINSTVNSPISIIVSLKFIGEINNTEEANKIPIEQLMLNRPLAIPKSKFGPAYANDEDCLKNMNNENEIQQNNNDELILKQIEKKEQKIKKLDDRVDAIYEDLKRGKNYLSKQAKLIAKNAKNLQNASFYKKTVNELRNLYKKFDDNLKKTEIGSLKKQIDQLSIASSKSVPQVKPPLLSNEKIQQLTKTIECNLEQAFTGFFENYDNEFKLVRDDLDNIKKVIHELRNEVQGLGSIVRDEVKSVNASDFDGDEGCGGGDFD